MGWRPPDEFGARGRSWRGLVLQSKALAAGPFLTACVQRHLDHRSERALDSALDGGLA